MPRETRMVHERMINKSIKLLIRPGGPGPGPEQPYHERASCLCGLEKHPGGVLEVVQVGGLEAQAGGGRGDTALQELLPGDPEQLDF